ncbi:uncharacterized protein PHACADRAFT_253552 [Phanerochaete carnosa HHB-10118-sp]|uniref:Uncharacterized protein n=1 Tax=Phanerochaete carnosa (strain HHB-10118-sp) TaxID=650164 RepID=K5WB61_PHACS|nr:uncharacterized protein PHACADRAFT_253552 [Phanerochaete carnosa HHB-10118-sp]EKM56435.1 hypothetical protein PHACADRAFT_253552 [Phanerochaete carnosa HHB-10118-sp]
MTDKGLRHGSDIYKEGISHHIFCTYRDYQLNRQPSWHRAFDPHSRIADNLVCMGENQLVVRVICFHRHAVPAEHLLPKGRTAGLGKANTDVLRRGKVDRRPGR